MEPGVTEENIQSRIRGNLLMALSNKFGYLLLSTGNKSEMAVGYCTLYGDMNGGLEVIADVPKTRVYHLCRWLNQKAAQAYQAGETLPPEWHPANLAPASGNVIPPTSSKSPPVPNSNPARWIRIPCRPIRCWMTFWNVWFSARNPWPTLSPLAMILS
jgi:hypothetical protein